MSKENPKAHDHKKYGSVMKGRSAEQLANYKKDFSSAKHKALSKVKTGYTREMRDKKRGDEIERTAKAIGHGSNDPKYAAYYKKD